MENHLALAQIQLEQQLLKIERTLNGTQRGYEKYNYTYKNLFEGSNSVPRATSPNPALYYDQFTANNSLKKKDEQDSYETDLMITSIINMKKNFESLDEFHPFSKKKRMFTEQPFDYEKRENSSRIEFSPSNWNLEEHHQPPIKWIEQNLESVALDEKEQVGETYVGLDTSDLEALFQFEAKFGNQTNAHTYPSKDVAAMNYEIKSATNSNPCTTGREVDPRFVTSNTKSLRKQPKAIEKVDLTIPPNQGGHKTEIKIKKNGVEETKIISKLPLFIVCRPNHPVKYLYKEEHVMLLSREELLNLKPFERTSS